MQLQDILRVLQRSWILIVSLTSLGLAAAALSLYLVIPQYQSSTQVFVSTQSLGTATDLLQGSTYTQNRMISYSHVVTAPVVLDPVITSLGLDTTAEELASKISATVITDSLILQVTVTDPSAQNAATIANAVGTQLVTTITTGIEQPVNGSKPLVSLSIISSAVPAASPTSPIPWLYLLVGGVGGFLLSVGVAFLLAGFDTRIRSLDDLKRLTETPILGTFPRRAESNNHPLLLAEDMMSQRAESFKALRTNLQYFDLTVNHQVLLFTSSIPGEGKTTTSLNLGVTLAQAGQKVLVIECDLRRPKVAKYMNIEGSVGISDVLVGRARLEDVMQTSGPTGNMTVVPAGSIPPNPSELLGSSQLANIVKAMRLKYDYVLIDAPPLLAVTDAAILSRISDGVIVVVGAGRVNRQQVTTSLEILQQVDADVLGLTANLLPRRGVDAYSYYTYGYTAPSKETADEDVVVEVAEPTPHEEVPDLEIRTGRRAAEQMQPATRR